MEKIKQITSLIITVLIGLFFIWSAYVKLISIDFYEITLVKQGLASWGYSRFISRIFLAIETTIGLLLIFQYRLKKITIPISFSFITLLTLFLLGRLLFVGNEDDCGCFGEAIKFTTVESLIKNIALLLLLFILWKNNVYISLNKWDYKKVVLSLFIVCTTSIVIYHPPVNIYKEFSVDGFKVADKFPIIDSLPSQAYEGKSIIALLSPTCKHCKHVAMKLKVMRDNNTDYKIYPVFGFGKSKIKYFMDKAEYKAEHYIIPKNDFLRLTQGAFPQVYILEDGKIKSILNKRRFLQENI